MKQKKRPEADPLFVAGLGNPGARYAGTRHNAGYLVLDILMRNPPLRFRKHLFHTYMSADLKVPDGGRSVLLLRSFDYMNHSGRIAAPLLRRHSAAPHDFIVVVDNMDLEPGVCRLKKGGGHAGHNGLKSIIHHLNSRDFYRLYIGVGRPYPPDSVIEHVLGRPDAHDAARITESCERAAQAIRDLAVHPAERVMEQLNRRES